MIINGNKLYVEKKIKEFSDSVVVITHGIAEHSGRYSHLIDRLYLAGFSVVSYDLRGHGKSEGRRGYVDSYQDFLFDLHEIVQSLKKDFKNIFLFGHSMGGEIVNLYNANYNDVNAIVDSAGSVSTPKDAKILKILPKFLIKNIKKKTDFKDTLTHNKEVVKAYQEDPLVLKYFFGKLAYEMFVRGVKEINSNVSKMTTPILILHGEEDKIVDPSFSKELFNKLTIEDKKIVIYPNSRHEILNEDCKELVIDEIIDWYKGHEFK